MSNPSTTTTHHATTHYDLLNLHPSASVQQIRQAYRDLSKLYHPDTTALPAAIATAKFQALNEAYAVLSSPDKRAKYDLSIGYSRMPIIQPLPELNRTKYEPPRSSMYLDPDDRPLSSGEVFVLFILAVTFVGCVALAIGIGLLRGEITP
jgi:curved DNA-binding protein CbpA